MAARKRKKAKSIGAAHKKKIWKSILALQAAQRKLDLDIKKHKKILAILSISTGGKP